MSQKIDFLGIGTQKSATSWLDNHLGRHPDIWTPYKKEIHYFDRSLKYASPSYLASNSLIKRFLGKEDHNERFRFLFKTQLKRAKQRKDWNLFWWTLRFFLGRVNDKWYLSLFHEGKGKLKGEITPSYSILDLADIERVHKLLPDLKLILILRNPIDRAWSQIGHTWQMGKIIDINDYEELRTFIDSPELTLRGDYLQILENWISFFPAEQIYIAYYDDIVLDPQKFIFNILEFLGVEQIGISNDTVLRKKINTKKQGKVPLEIENYLAEKYILDLDKMRQSMGGHTEAWFEKAQEILNRN